MAPPKRPPIERFLEKVDRSKGPCWEWTASKDKDGYGTFQLDGKKTPAHRAAFILFIDDLQEGEQVLHSCDNPGCVKPVHLRVGTAQDNVNDMLERNRRPKHYKITEQQVKENQKDIAKSYGISQTHVSRLKSKF
jgi:hypothetical protein